MKRELIYAASDAGFGIGAVMLVGSDGGLYVISATTLVGVSHSGSAANVKQAFLSDN